MVVRSCNTHFFALSFFSVVSTKDQVIDGESLKCMNEDTLKTLVPLVGPRLKIMEKINKLNAQESTGNCSFQSMPSGMPTIVVQEDEPLAADKGETQGTSDKRMAVMQKRWQKAEGKECLPL
ncbi:uncharacterized protein LOC144655562 [Oculina patagonica]